MNKRIKTKKIIERSQNVVAEAVRACEDIGDVEDNLDIDHVLPPNDLVQMRLSRRVSTVALKLAADVVRASPERFPDFDAGVIDAAVEYDNAMSMVLERARELATHVDKSMLKRRSVAAEQTMALYATLKGLGRITANETIREKVKLLKAELTMNKGGKKRSATARKAPVAPVQVAEAPAAPKPAAPIVNPS